MPTSSTVPDADEEQHVLSALYGDEADPEPGADTSVPPAEPEAAGPAHTGTGEDDPKEA